MSLDLLVFHLPWGWKFLSLTPEFAAMVVPPDLPELVLYLEMSGTIPLNEAETRLKPFAALASALYIFFSSSESFAKSCFLNSYTVFQPNFD